LAGLPDHLGRLEEERRGIVKLSAFAVLRLMTSAYRAGRSMKKPGIVVGLDAIARSV
jgi:hypothetical protein